MEVGGYMIDVVRIAEYLVLLALAAAATPWVMWTVFKRPLFGSHAAFGLQRSADRLRKQADEAWSKRPVMLHQLTSLVIGAAGGCIELFIIGLNLLILSRIFDFLGLSGLNTFEPDLPFIGKMGDEVGVVSMIAAAIFVAVQCGLGVVLFFLWHAPLRPLPSPDHEDAPMTRATKVLAGIVAFLLLAAAGFECYMNYLQAVTLTDSAAAYVGIAAAFIGLIVPLAAVILSGFAWHAAVVPLCRFAICATLAVYYRCAAVWVGWFSYPHSDVRLCARVGAELNALARQLRASYRHLREVCRRASELPAVKDDTELVQTLQSIRAKLRNV